MKTQKFVAPTMREALARVKEELGEDAMIVKSEKVKVGGALNFLKQDMIEVTAASPEEVKADLQDGPEFADTLRESLTPAQVPSISPRSQMDMSVLKEEVQRLHEELVDIGKFIKYKNLPNMPRELCRLWQTMGESGVNSQWATDLAQEALVHLNAEELISAQSVENYVINKLTTVIRPAPNVPLRKTALQRIALVGSPGAGKTSLIQKLASDPLAYGKRKVGLVSFDTHRMAAIEQIKSFARIAGTPLEVVFQPSQVREALARLSGCDVILIDTPGCTATDRDRLQELKAFMDALDPHEVHLVQNSGVRDEDLIWAGKRFRDLGMTHLSFTRLDESLRHGYLLNVVRETQRPVAWLSNGQNFIGSIERFTPDHLRRWIVLSAPLPEAEEDSYDSDLSLSQRMSHVS
jgi:flagellar biosynthesis protein FlhF